MASNVIIDPITRIEGHLAIKVEIEGNTVSKAYCTGEMFRGFETILHNRDPLDAQQITQRICGVCPISHGTASCLAQESAYSINPPDNGRIARNLILGANYIQSHIIHFYHLSALDFVDITAIKDYKGSDSDLLELKAWVNLQLSSKQLFPVAPFLPRFESKRIENSELNILGIKHYLDALTIRSEAHKAGAIFGGKLPHATTLMPGGITELITAKKIVAFISIIRKIKTFIETAYLNDIIEIGGAFPDYFQSGQGCKNFLAYGVFHETSDKSKTFFPSGVILNGSPQGLDSSKIAEYTQYSKYSSPSGLSPQQGQTIPAPKKSNAYSWLKAPRYDGHPMEVGPLARVLVAYQAKSIPQLNTMVDKILSKLNLKPENLISTMGRHAARAIECKFVADKCLEWAEQLNPNQPVFTDFEIPESCSGIGLTEAPRGALGHWISVKNKRIHNYQCVVPTTWNCSPKDDSGTPGPVEQALIGCSINDEKNPIEACRIVRSFDPCIACAVH